jgi:nucleoside-diphosphate-sugar epimerase
MTMNELAHLITSEFDSPLEIKLNTSSSYQLQNTRFVPDISLAQQNLQLFITVDIKTAIQRTVHWNKKIFS